MTYSSSLKQDTVDMCNHVVEYASDYAGRSIKKQGSKQGRTKADKLVEMRAIVARFLHVECKIPRRIVGTALGYVDHGSIHYLCHKVYPAIEFDKSYEMHGELKDIETGINNRIKELGFHNVNRPSMVDAQIRNIIAKMGKRDKLKVRDYLFNEFPNKV